MNIAHLLPYGAQFPLKSHHGRYEWALRLAETQAQQGHTVTVYAGPRMSPDVTSGIRWVTIPEYAPNKDERNRKLLQQAFGDHTHQIYHSHFDFLHYAMAHATNQPIIVTQHWFPNEAIIAAASTRPKNVIAVPTTHYMKRTDEASGITCSDVIYHGIDLSLFAFSGAPRTDRLLFIGRIGPHKGVREAIELVRSNNQQLDIVGKIEKADEPYWQTLAPYVDGQRIRYLGPKLRAEVPGLFAQAKALLFLPQHIESFGQTIVESQACGTPVITNDIGANSELVNNGVTGWAVSNPAAYAEAFATVASLDPANCRQFAEQFDEATMVQAYEHLYAQSLSVVR